MKTTNKYHVLYLISIITLLTIPSLCYSQQSPLVKISGPKYSLDGQEIKIHEVEYIFNHDAEIKEMFQKYNKYRKRCKVGTYIAGTLIAVGIVYGLEQGPFQDNDIGRGLAYATIIIGSGLGAIVFGFTQLSSGQRMRKSRRLLVEKYNTNLDYNPATSFISIGQQKNGVGISFNF